MNNNNELKIYKQNEKDIREKDIQQEKQLAKEKGLKHQPYSNLNNFIQYSIGDNIQNFIDYDEKGNQTLRNGIVKYGYGARGQALKGRDNAEIVFLNAFSPEEIEKQINEIIYKPIVKIKSTEHKGEIKETNYSILLKKVELYFVEQLYNSFSGGSTENSTIVIKDMELAKNFNVSRNYINQKMNSVLVALSQMQIRSYTPGKAIRSNRNKKETIPGLRLVNLIQDAAHINGETQITFNDKFATYIGLCSPLQIPNEIYTIKDPLSYDIALYLYGQVRQKESNTFKIKVGTLYNTIRQIPRYENVKGRNYQREIYQPLEKTFELLEDMKLISINYEDTNYITENKTYDFNKWIDTNLVIKVLKEPDLQALRDNRNHYRQLAKGNEEKVIKKAIEKKIIKENQDKIDKAVNETWQQIQI